jgi:hypothetical protein
LYLDVISSLLGEIVVGLGVSRGLVPPGHLVVDDFGAIEDLLIRRVRGKLLYTFSLLFCSKTSIGSNLAGLWVSVANSHLDCLKGIKNIELQG